MSANPSTAAIAHPPRKGRKYFTPHEANRALPFVRRVVHDIVECYRQAVRIRRSIEHGHPDFTLQQLRDQYEQQMDRLNTLIGELHLVGVELKDFERGLIDFPAVFQGREVYLCWQRGEAEVSTWHEIDAGYATRQDLSRLVDETAGDHRQAA